VTGISVIMRVLVFLLILGCALAMKSYRGHKIMRVVPRNEVHMQTLRKLEADFPDIDFWTDPHMDKNVDINVPPFYKDYVIGLFNSVHMIPDTIQNDLQKLIDVTDARSARSARAGNIVGQFVNHQAILTWLDQTAAKFPRLARIKDIGTTYEGRTQRTIIVGADSSSTKPIIWVDSAIHAREWLTTGTTIWIINYMLENYETDATVRGMMDHYDWHFLPVANPDGYDYTFTGDRLWRKTRRPNSGSSCRGTDPNRNWDAAWGTTGVSADPCAQTFPGSGPFSEKCTQNMRDRISELSGNIKLYMAVHSYSQMWLTPWGFGSPKPADYSELLDVANAGNDALRRTHGIRFEVGTPPDILYSASGGAYDWAKSVAGIKYAYTFELRPSSYSWNGFVVDASVIEPSGEEIWAALSTVADRIM